MSLAQNMTVGQAHVMKHYGLPLSVSCHTQCSVSMQAVVDNTSQAHTDAWQHFCEPTVTSCAACRLVKAGLLDKKYAKRFSTISAWAELIGYVGNVTLNGLRIAAALERELMLTTELVRRKKVCYPLPHVSFTVHCLQASLCG